MAEDLYRSIVESAEDPIFVSDADARYIYVNRAAAATFGLTPEAMTGKTVDELFPPHIAAGYRAGVRQVFDSGVTLKSDDRSEIAGVETWFSTVLQPLRDAAGTITAVQGFVRDVTSRKHAEQALLVSEERLRQAIRASNIGIWDLDFIAQTVFWSPQQRVIWGWGPDEPIGWNEYLNCVHPEDRERVDAAIAQVQHSDDGVFEVEHRIVRRDGSVRWLVARGQNVDAGEGADRHPVRSIGATRDITDEKAAVIETAELQTQLAHSQKLESIGRLAGGLAHDFNNILSIIIGSAEMARVETDRSVVGEHLAEILKASKRSSDLTRQLLGFARRQTARPRVVDLNDFVSASLKMLSRLIGEHLTLSWHPGVDLWPVRIDPGQVDQILVNLVANARDAISEVGAVVIRTENIAVSACAQYSGLVPAEYVCLSVVDNGQGMDAETQQRLFEPFYTTKGLGHGTGLGMASVDGIVRQNNGAVTVQSAVGRGTTVNVFLPREAAAVTANVAIATDAPKGGTETVLVVDDEPGLLRLAVRTLEMRGYTVLTAGSPDDALAMVSAHRGPLNILVTDIVMPGMNGWTLAERLVEVLPTLKCLFMSAYTNGVMGEGEKIHENVHFLQKPFSPTALAAKVRQVLEA